MKQTHLLVVLALLFFGVAPDPAARADDPTMRVIHDVLYIPTNLDVPNWLQNDVAGLELKQAGTIHVLDLPSGIELRSVGDFERFAKYDVTQEEDPVYHDGEEYTRFLCEPTLYHNNNRLFGPIFLRSTLPDGTRKRIYFRSTWTDPEPGEQDFQSVEAISKTFPEPGPPSTEINSALLWMFLEGVRSWPDTPEDGHYYNMLDSYNKLGFNSVTAHGSYDLNFPLEERQAFLTDARARGNLTMNIHSPFSVGYVNNSSTNSTDENGNPLQLDNPDACPAYRGDEYWAEIDKIADLLLDTLGADRDQSDIESFKQGALRGLGSEECQEAPCECHRCYQYIENYQTQHPGSTDEDAMIALGTEIQSDINQALADRAASLDPPQPKPRLGAYNTRPGDYVYQYLFKYDELRAAGIEDSVPINYGVGDGHIGNLVRGDRAKENSDSMQVWLSEGGLFLAPLVDFEFRLARTYDDTIEGFGGGAKGLLWFAYHKFEASDFYYFAKAMENITPISEMLGETWPVDVSTDHPEILASAITDGNNLILVLRDYSYWWVADSVEVTYAPGFEGEIWDLARNRKLGEANGEQTLELAFLPGVNGARTTMYYVGGPLYPGVGPTQVALAPETHGAKGGNEPETFTYTASVSNNDAGSEGASTFDLSLTVPPDWSGSIDPASLELDPGETESATVFVTSPAGTESGVYAFTVEVEGQGGPPEHEDFSTGRVDIGDLEQDLVAHWKLDESEGTAASDSTGRGNDGELVEGPIWQPTGGQVGGALEFDGIDDYVSVADSDDINLGSYLRRTVSFWFNVEDKTLSQRQVIYQEGKPAYGLNLYVFEGALYVGGWNYPSTPADGTRWRGTYVSNAAIESGRWHHVALVLDAKDLPHAPRTKSKDTFKAYLDGQLIGTGEGSELWPHDNPFGPGISISLGALLNGSQFHCTDDEELQGLCRCPSDVEDCYLAIGGPPWGPETDYFFKGLIDEGRIYNRALSEAEVQLLADTKPPTKPTNLHGGACLGNKNFISWTAGTDEVGVSKHELFRDAAHFDWVPMPAVEYCDESADPDTKYTYTVKAKDAAGNLSPAPTGGLLILKGGVVQQPGGCGIGFELVLLLPGLWWLHARVWRRRSAAAGGTAG